jgi:hypothetical protein
MPRHCLCAQEIEGRTVDMRAEVGCLTRNVQIEGDSASAADSFGAHVMLHSPPSGIATGANAASSPATTHGRISHVECRRCGQAFLLGRYPLHFHMLGNASSSYIRGAAVVESYNRAVTLHGVHYLTVADVVAYNNMGHTFFIEDAIESHNRCGTA